MSQKYQLHWRREDVIQLIELYKDNMCFWQVRAWWVFWGALPIHPRLEANAIGWHPLPRAPRFECVAVTAWNPRIVWHRAAPLLSAASEDKKGTQSYERRAALHQLYPFTTMFDVDLFI